MLYKNKKLRERSYSSSHTRFVSYDIHMDVHNGCPEDQISYAILIYC